MTALLSLVISLKVLAQATRGTPDSTAIFPKEIYYVDRKSAENRKLIEFELASAFDLAGVRAPKRQCISRCQWVYKPLSVVMTRLLVPGKVVDGVGVIRFNADNEEVTSDADDVCGKRQSSYRFGENNELPFGVTPHWNVLRMTWRDTALQDAKDRDPWEAVGLVVVVKGREKYWACRNMAHNWRTCLSQILRIRSRRRCR